MKQLETIELDDGSMYAKAATRIKAFREDCPFGLIETSHSTDRGFITFKARILKDKENPRSGESTGHSMGANDGDKCFEALETIAVGRALAMLGYLVTGEVASSEEMERFILDKEDQWAKEIQAIQTTKELRDYWVANKGLGKVFDKMIKARKDSLTTQK